MTAWRRVKSKLRRYWRAVKSWLEDYGAALLVVLAIAGATLIALPGNVPEPVPDYSLQSKSLYRVFVAGAAFLVFAAVISILVMALNGWVLTHLGLKGVQGDQVVKSSRTQQVMLKRHDGAIDGLERSVERNQVATSLGTARANKQEERLEALEMRLNHEEAKRSTLERRLEELEGSQSPDGASQD